MTPRPMVNRTLLALTGLVLLGGGLLIGAAGLDLYATHHLAPPTGWPLTTADDVLLSSADRARWSDQGWWWWPAVVAALALFLALALWWLLAQLPRRTADGLPVGGDPPQDGVELRARALGDAIATEAGTLPGVQRATVRITGRSARPRAHVTLVLTPEGTPATALGALCEGPLRTALQSTRSPAMPTEARLRVARHKPRRAE
ncbi:alkaline shock response membrane anchor protein AmaP [Streptomyces sp. NPDC048664]|uniref:alkaline shock response membrane anchor protein AmaP n=1 Tax=Streptomyces sp. NPDC048664 TaxID=3154505 RepID=UPI00343DB94A